MTSPVVFFDIVKKKKKPGYHWFHMENLALIHMLLDRACSVLRSFYAYLLIASYQMESLITTTN